MRAATHRSSGEPTADGALRQWGRDLGVAALPLLAMAVGTWWLFGLSASYVAQALGLYAVMCGVLIWNAQKRPMTAGLGAANRITLGRATLVLPIAALVFHPESARDAAYWWIIVWSIVAMLLDSLDGRVARRTGTTSAIGARFDMELDAFLMLALSLFVLQSGKVGPWVILIGALRYLFVGAGWVWRELSEELPESQRRKTVCVVQGAVLLVCLGPIIASEIAPVVAAGALALLVYSFMVDIVWLVRQGRGNLPTHP